MSKTKSKDILYKVISVCYQNARNVDPGEADFFLEEDNWNDFGYRTTYHLHATKNITGNENRHLGPINVMKKGQTIEDVNILTQLYKSQKGYFNKLPDDYCSISFSAEMYLQLSKLLSDTQRKAFAEDLRMVFSKESPIYEEFKDESCFEISLLRDASMDAYNLRQGQTIMMGSDVVYYDLETKPFSFTLPNRGNAEFTCNVLHIEGVDNTSLPTGIIVFIGHNGSGKSTILYQMAKVLYASPRERTKLKDIITVSPSNIGIMKLLMFSYSAFDNFVLPGMTLSDYQLMSDGMADNSGRFVYCGLRDVKSALDTLLEIERNERYQNTTTSKGNPEDRPLENYREDHLKDPVVQKSLCQLAAEFETALAVILSDKTKNRLWQEMIERSKELLPPLYDDINAFSEKSENNVSAFQSLSTGIKFFLHALTHLMAYIIPNSLILFDEPENHLHPPLLSFLLGEFRRVIHENHSVMLVATHSPVILQETFAKNIYVIKKYDGSLTISHPVSETFGENFGFINNMVFELTTDMANFYAVCDSLYEQWNCQSMTSADDIIELYAKKFGTQYMSSQLTAYLISKYMEDKI